MSNLQKYWVAEGSKDWLLEIIRKRGSYSDKYTPDIFQPNAFSSSALTYSLEEQVSMKFGLKESPNEKQVAGQAIHEFIQGKLSASYACDAEIRYSIKFEWKSIPAKEILIICHPDAFSLFQKNLLEYKTSFGKDANGKIMEYQVRQAAFYWLVLKEQTGIDCDVRVVKLWSKSKDEGGITEWTLQPDEKLKYSKSMIDRAIFCAEKLDKLYAEKGTKPFGTPDYMKQAIDQLFNPKPPTK